MKFTDITRYGILQLLTFFAIFIFAVYITASDVKWFGVFLNE